MFVSRESPTRKRRLLKKKITAAADDDHYDGTYVFVFVCHALLFFLPKAFVPTGAGRQVAEAKNAHEGEWRIEADLKGSLNTPPQVSTRNHHP